MLDYANCKNAIKVNVSKEDIFSLDEIVRNYKSLYKNVQAHTKFLNEQECTR